MSGLRPGLTDPEALLGLEIVGGLDRLGQHHRGLYTTNDQRDCSKGTQHGYFSWLTAVLGTECYYISDY